MKTLILLCLAVACQTATAQFAIYNYTAVQNVTGSGSEATLRLSGVLIIDLATDRAIRVGRTRLNGEKKLIEGEESNFTVSRAQGRTSSHTLVVASQFDDTPGNRQSTVNHYWGRESLLDLGAGLGGVWLPKAVKGSGYALIDNGAPFVAGFSVQTSAHTYSAKATADANLRTTDLDAVVRHYHDLYVAQGYQ